MGVKKDVDHCVEKAATAQKDYWDLPSLSIEDLASAMLPSIMRALW
jgi:hypothetical protein